MRAGDSKLRPMHLMCHPFPRPQRGSRVSAPNVVIGIGNRFRRDDGSALQVLNALAGRLPESTVVIESDGEPARLIDSWADAPVAVVVETVRQNRAPESREPAPRSGLAPRGPGTGR